MSLRVGFVGLGDMGKPMAERLAANSAFSLTVFDTRPAQTVEVVALGALAASSLGELAARSEIICVVVRTTDEVKEVILGPEGLLARLAEGSVVVVHSTVSPKVLQEIAAVCDGRGVALLDVPVSGGAPAARNGALSMMVGGDRAVLERCRPVLEVHSGEIFHLGGVGAGQVGKIINNLSYNISVVNAAECVRLAAAAGIAQESIVSLLQASSGVTYPILNWTRCMEHGAVDAPRLSAIRHKDVCMALELARELGVEARLGALTESCIDWAIGAGGADQS